MEKVQANWHGKKQVCMMIYLGIVLLIGGSLISGCTNTILPAIADTYNWDVATLRVMAGVGTFFAVAGTFLFGTMTKKKGPKIVIVLTLILTAVSVIVMGNTSNYYVFIACLLVNGFAAGGYFYVGFSALTANWWPTKKGVVLGYVTCGIVLNDVTWQPFIPKAFAAIGIDITLDIVAAFVVLVAIVGIFFIKNSPEEAGEYPDGDPSYGENAKRIVDEMAAYKSPFTPKVLLSSGLAWKISIAMGCMYAAGMTFVASVVPRILSLGYEYDFAALVLIVAGFFGLIGSILYGMLDQKIGTKKTCVVYACLCILITICCLLHSVSVAFIWISAICFFASNAAMGNLVPSIVAGKYGRWDYPAAYSIIGAIVTLGAGIGILCTGLFTNYNLMYAMDIGLFVIALVLLSTIDEKLIGKPN